MRLELAGAQVYSGFTESSDINDDLNRVRINSGIAALQSQYQADLVMMITASQNYSARGLGYLAATIQGLPYTVIPRSSLTGLGNGPGYTFTHEVGHNQGAQHHRADPAPGGTTSVNNYFPEGYGWRFMDSDYIIINIRDTYYSTVMAYAGDQVTSPNNYVRIPRFSNPRIQYDDQPTGVASSEDNAAVLETTAQGISNLYVPRYGASASIWGGNTPYEGTYTFDGYTYGSESPSTYAWYLTSNPNNYGSVRSTARSFSTVLGPGTMYAKFVTWSAAGTMMTAYATVSVLSGCGPQARALAGGAVLAEQGPTLSRGLYAALDPDFNDGPAHREYCPGRAAPGTGETLARGGDSTGEAARGTSTDPMSADFTEALVVSPNPMAASGRITVGLREAGDIRVAVYDLLGREVRFVWSGTAAAGTHTFAVGTSDLPSGLYVARLTVNGSVTARQFVVGR